MQKKLLSFLGNNLIIFAKMSGRMIHLPDCFHGSDFLKFEPDMQARPKPLLND